MTQVQIARCASCQSQMSVYTQKKYMYVCIYIYSVYDGTMLFVIYIYIQMHFENQFDQGMFVFRVDLGSFV